MLEQVSAANERNMTLKKALAAMETEKDSLELRCLDLADDLQEATSEYQRSIEKADARLLEVIVTFPCSDSPLCCSLGNEACYACHMCS